jgi:peptide/nickel transport system substrate-binding protein
VVKVDRVEWIYIPDPATAAAALNAGEVDWWEQAAFDRVPMLRRNTNVRVESRDSLGSIGIMRFNFLHPPFSNQKMRQALLYVVDQHDYLLAIAGDEKSGRTCFSLYACGTPLSSEVGAEPLKGKRDFERAKKMVHESGYKGEKVVIISATDYPTIHTQSLLTADLLHKLGLNVELQASDWGTVLTRRTSKEPVEKGGWSIFHGVPSALDLLSPANNGIAGTGEKAWFGWPTNDKLEKLREAWFNASDAAAAKKAADEVQLEAFKFVAYIPTAQYVIPTAYRSNLSGIMVAPVIFLWNVEKK